MPAPNITRLARTLEEQDLTPIMVITLKRHDDDRASVELLEQPYLREVPQRRLLLAEIIHQFSEMLLEELARVPK